MCVCGGITEEAFGFVNMYSVEIVTANFMKGVACETTTKKNGNLPCIMQWTNIMIVGLPLEVLYCHGYHNIIYTELA